MSALTLFALTSVLERLLPDWSARRSRTLRLGGLDVDELQLLDPLEVLPVPRREWQVVPQTDTRLHAVREPDAHPTRLQG